MYKMLKNSNIITILFFIFMGCENLFNDDTVYGCLEQNACNYSSVANTNDPELCEYPQNNYDCNGDCLVEVDQCGQCGGNGLDSDLDGICDDQDPCIGISQNGYFCSDIQVLFDFVSNNSVLDSIDVYDIGNTIGITNWENGRLTYLSLANLGLTDVPYSISLLDSLGILFLNNNNISQLPSTLCQLPSSCTIFLQNNNLCEEYQTSEWNCIYQFSPQDCIE